MTFPPKHNAVSRRSVMLGSSAVALTAGLAACGDDSDAAAGDTGGATTIRFALDWTPNTNHTGLFVAQEKGYFSDAGLEVEILPYNNSSTATLVGAASAEFGINFQGPMTFARAAGTPITSVMAVLQKRSTGLGVKADRDDIASPADLDGKTYAGFGSPGEKETLTTIVQNAGGTGDVTIVTLQTSAYEAVYAGEADATTPFATWEAIEAELRGQPFKMFAFSDYGFPEVYEVVVIGNDDWMAANADATAGFVQAVQKGYQFAVDNPEEAAQILIDANPGAFEEEELVTRSQAMLSADYMTDANGAVGPQVAEQWSAFTQFLFDEGLLVDEAGAVLTEPPAAEDMFSNEYLA
jgi:ABC-type nitrate/sulfonate/bicarbonate transport system substrate-binding protein